MNVQNIKNNLHLFSYEELIQIKKAIIDEIWIKVGDKKAVSCFWNIMIRAFNRYNTVVDKKELLITLSEYTEKEFYDFPGVGEKVMKVAKYELEKFGLNFKLNERTNI